MKYVFLALVLAFAIAATHAAGARDVQATVAWTSAMVMAGVAFMRGDR